MMECENEVNEWILTETVLEGFKEILPISNHFYNVLGIQLILCLQHNHQIVAMLTYFHQHNNPENWLSLDLIYAWTHLMDSFHGK